MDQLIPEAFIVTACALIITLISVPFLTKLSNRLGLIDRPGERKVHINNTPVIGGMAIVGSVALSLLLSKTALGLIVQYPVMLSGALILFVTGVWDDRKNISPSLRLMLQLLCAAAVAASGIRLTSLYGLFGVEEINIYCQYTLTILLIAGVTNAFNLIDGIDGLAGGISLIGIAVVSMLCIALKEYGLFMLFAALGGAIIGFLRYNLFPAKIFMGDGGSLTLGFLLPTAGILLIEKAHTSGFAESGYVIVLLMAVLSIPVLDSLRVYISRMMRGGSPFKADKTHLHHLLLHAGFNHGRSTLLICAAKLSIVLMAILFYKIGGVYSSLIAIASVSFLAFNALKWVNRPVKVEGSF